MPDAKDSLQYARNSNAGISVPNWNKLFPGSERCDSLLTKYCSTSENNLNPCDCTFENVIITKLWN